MKIGVGYRRELLDWVLSRPDGLECLEITAEHFYGCAQENLAALRTQYPLLLHGLGLSLGTPGPLDADRLRSFVEVSRIADPEWISEHVAFTRTREIDLGHLNPVPSTPESVRILADHARALSDACQKDIVLENITSHLRLTGAMRETDFLNELCLRADCGLLLDVTNLYINSRNHGFDPFEWVNQLDPSRIRQLHIVGYALEDGRYSDQHATPIQEDLLDLARHILSLARVRAVILERDEAFPGPDGMQSELTKLLGLRPDVSPRQPRREHEGSGP